MHFRSQDARSAKQTNKKTTTGKKAYPAKNKTKHTSRVMDFGEKFHRQWRRTFHFQIDIPKILEKDGDRERIMSRVYETFKAA